MKIGIIGSGYVGLVTGVCLAERGHTVVCIDKNERIIKGISVGKAHILETGLDDLLEKNLSTDRFSATTGLEAALKGAEVVFIAVGTPFDGREIDLTFVKAVCGELGAWLKGAPGYPVIVIKSTVVPTTAELTVVPLLERASGKKVGADFGVCSNPEFLREGSAVADFMNPDRIVIGGSDARSIAVLREVYEWAECPIMKTDLRTAEMVKYTSNALLPTLISFSNEIANLCEELGGVDAREVMAALHLDFRLNPVINGKRANPGILSYLEAGCGFGGSCFPKDVNAFIAFSEKYNAPLNILKQTASVNARQPIRMVDILERECRPLAGKTIAVLGLAFKPDTNDTRESPAIAITAELARRGARVVACDPAVREEFNRIPGCEKVEHVSDWRETVKGAHGAVLVTKWRHFAEITGESLAALMAAPVLLDTRRFFKKELFANMKYIGTGMGNK